MLLENLTSIDSAMLPFKNHMDNDDVTRFRAGARSTQTDDVGYMLRVVRTTRSCWEGSLYWSYCLLLG